MTFITETSMSQASEQFAASRRRMSSNFKELIDSAEELVHAASALSGEGVAAARIQLQTQLDTLKAQAAVVEANAIERYRDAKVKTDAYVHDNPWNAVGVSAAVGFLVGVLISRR
jgi:ElaB/YqjD/DUF883 family membrane-anchored ribosome-binding protein